MQSLKTFISIHRSVKVRPTKYFFLLLFGIIGLFMQAYMHNYNIVYVMMFFLVSVAGTSTYFGMKNLHPLRVAFVAQDRFFASQNASFTLKISNVAEYALYDLRIYHQTRQETLKSLQPLSATHVRFESLYATRGYHALKSIRVESLFPLMHEKKSREFALNAELLVFAKPEGVSLLERLAKEQKESGDLSDFESIESFVQGESLAKIHWASLAKNESLMKKRFLYEEEQQSLHFFYETLQGDKETRLSQLTLWAVECESQGVAFKLTLAEKELDSKEDGVDGVLKALALY